MRDERSTVLFRSRMAALASLGVAGLMVLSRPAAGQGLLQLANPHWNITLTDFGYSDFLLDNTPGFEGREYLSGEWGAAVAYQVTGQPAVTPKWLEPNFIFPDWPTLSPFHVVSTIVQTGVNTDGLPIAQSVVANSDVEITLRHEMLDTVVGTPMGTRRASAGGAGASIHSSRYVLKQTCTIRNISGAALSGLQFFQFLHGLNAQRGVYDSRLYTGPLSAFRYDVTEWGVDAWAVGAGSSTNGLEDYIGFHASVAPSGFEIGYYGIEGNGVDAHGIGKPSDGVHLSIENNWLTPPYSARLGTDEFAPPQRWIGGVERWNLGSLPAGQSVSLDVLLTVRTGTRVTTGTGATGGCNGGASVPGGVDYEFEDVTGAGACFGEYSQADAAELEAHIAAGEFDAFTFMTPGGPAQLWELEFSGSFAGSVSLTFGYDPTLMPAGFDEGTLCIYQFAGGAWQLLPSVVDPVRHTVTVTTDSLSTFVLGSEGGVSYVVTAVEAPGGSGTIVGDGTYAGGSLATLVASAGGGHAFSNWTEGGSVVSTSPSYTFNVQADRTLVANFVPVGAGRSISTIAQPANGGSTAGDGAYAPGSLVTVVATAGDGYKFSKWLEGATTVSTLKSYSFTVSSNRVLTAKFKPVYTMVVSAEPPDGGDVEADPVYEPGELAVLKAKPNSGYAFVNWTQNGVPVSDDATYQFTVTASRELVGNFAPGYRVDAVAEPVNAGTVAGAGVYDVALDVTLEATANPGYVFLNWMETGTVVSSNAVYSFPSDAPHSLVANFIALPPIVTTLSAPGIFAVRWPTGAVDWVMQENWNIVSPTWADTTNAIGIVSNQNQVTVPSPPESGFFRLLHP